VLAGLFLIGGLATLGLPGLSPFVSEFLVLVGAFNHEAWLGVVAVTGIVLAAVYVLLMYQRTMTGPTREELTSIKDLDLREVGAVAPLVLAMVLLGFFPQPALDVINPATEHFMEQVDQKDDPPTVDPDDVPAENEEAHP
jgi:NADH-quinone oxidoreductase subunit M